MVLKTETRPAEQRDPPDPSLGQTWKYAGSPELWLFLGRWSAGLQPPPGLLLVGAGPGSPERGQGEQQGKVGQQGGWGRRGAGEGGVAGAPGQFQLFLPAGAPLESAAEQKIVLVK